MKRFASALAAGLFVWCSTASAEQIDLSAWTCKKLADFAGSGLFRTNDTGDKLAMLLGWLDAHYGGADDPPIIDTDKLISNAKKIGDYCSENPNVSVITATDKLFKKH